MSIKIGYNVSAMIANNSLRMNDNNVSTALERLSSGYKINHAKDNAAGLAIARRMSAQLRGLEAAEQDAKDGESIVEIADGALSEVHDMLQRMNELAVKASTGTITDEDRESINAEVQQLKDEITRIGQTTEFNGQKLFDGTFDLKGYSNSSLAKVDYYSDNVESGTYQIGFTFSQDADGNDTSSVGVTNERGETIPAKLKYSEQEIIIVGDNDFEIRLGVAADWITADNKLDYDKISADLAAANPTSPSNMLDLSLDLTGIGAMTLQIGANEGQTIDVRIPELNLINCGINSTDMTTEAGAKKAIDEIAGAIEYVSEMRSRMGAYQNRLGHTETNLATSFENMTAAYSRIMDTDMATEMTNYTNLQVVSQAATAMLAQANERPSQMLQLLQ